MYLKSIKINGFKSFARETVLSFQPGITAIVGPNGSGKSNFSDAIRWVMGEQSLKSLRGRKAEDVIFSGSEKQSRLGMAEVTLELNNESKTVPIDYEELSITRKIYRDGASDYFLNQSRAKLAEINLLLTRANFGHRTYAIIGQGMIDNFLIASREERKNFLEEATGVKQYQIKKNQALIKLADTARNLETLTVKIKEIEPQLRLFERQLKKLEKRKKTEAELISWQRGYYGSLRVELERQSAEEKAIIAEESLAAERSRQIYLAAEDEIRNLIKGGESGGEAADLRREETKLIDEKLQIKEEIFKWQAQMGRNEQVAGRRKEYFSLPAESVMMIERFLGQVADFFNKYAAAEGGDLKSVAVILAREAANAREKMNSILNKDEEREKQASEENSGIKKKLTLLGEKLKTNEREIDEVKGRIARLTLAESREKADLWQKQKKYQEEQAKIQKIQANLNERRVALARIETRLYSLNSEIETELGSGEFPRGVVFDEKKMREAPEVIASLKRQLEVIGGIDAEVEKEYGRTKERYQFLSGQADDLRKTNSALEDVIGELNATIKNQMDKNFRQINDYFEKYFRILFNGGRSRLIVVKDKPDYEEEEESINEAKADNFFQDKKSGENFGGIEIEATPPGKKLKSVSALSGGERALTSIALISAIIAANPAPFVVLDEVDAALDEANSLRFAAILKEIASKTQVIVITHNRATMEEAEVIYGVTISDDGVSKVLSIKLTEAEKYRS